MMTSTHTLWALTTVFLLSVAAAAPSDHSTITLTSESLLESMIRELAEKEYVSEATEEAFGEFMSSPSQASKKSAMTSLINDLRTLPPIPPEEEHFQIDANLLAQLSQTSSSENNDSDCYSCYAQAGMCALSCPGICEIVPWPWKSACIAICLAACIYFLTECTAMCEAEPPGNQTADAERLVNHVVERLMTALEEGPESAPSRLQELVNPPSLP